MLDEMTERRNGSPTPVESRVHREATDSAALQKVDELEIGM